MCWLYKCHDDKMCDIGWLRTDLMTCLEPEWATCIQDKVSHTKNLNELMNILTVTVMNNYSLITVRMWALHKEAPEGTTFFQHFNRTLELLDFSKLKELCKDCYKTAFFSQFPLQRMINFVSGWWKRPQRIATKR